MHKENLPLAALLSSAILSGALLLTACGGGGSTETIPPASSSSSSGGSSSSSGSSSSGGSSSSSSSGGPIGTNSIVIEENTPGFCHVDGQVILTSALGNTGDGYAQPSGERSDGLDYRVQTPSAGNYEFRFRYSSASSGTGSLAVNESAMTSIEFPATGGGSDWQETSAVLALEAGENRINLGPGGPDAGERNQLPLIDSLTVTGDQPQAVECAFTYAAQNAQACAALTPPVSDQVDPGELMGFAAIPGRGLGTTTGGGDAAPVTVETTEQLRLELQGDAPKVIQVSGTLEHNGRDMLDVGSNTTLRGINGAVLDGFGLKVSGVHNVIIENLTFTNSRDDGVTIENQAHHVWVHHNHFLHPINDGSVDSRRDSSHITIAWNIFENTDKTSLIGSNDTEFESRDSWITYHHNWFKSTVQRNPRVRFAQVHLFNNYYEQIQSYGAVSIQFAQIVANGNHFHLNHGNNLAISTGTTVTSPHKGEVVQCDNFTQSGRYETRGLGFDPGDFYDYKMVAGEAAASLVTANAGPQ